MLETLTPERLGRMAGCLQQIARKDRAIETAAEEEKPDLYEVRNRYVMSALMYAERAGLACGIGWDHEVNWPIVFIDLPNAGQVSWHVAPYAGFWDGHTKDDAYARVNAYLETVGLDTV